MLCFDIFPKRWYFFLFFFKCYKQKKSYIPTFFQIRSMFLNAAVYAICCCVQNLMQQHLYICKFEYACSRINNTTCELYMPFMQTHNAIWALSYWLIMTHTFGNCFRIHIYKKFILSIHFICLFSIYMRW